MATSNFNCYSFLLHITNYNFRNGIHLTFFAASSGLIRFINQTLSEQLYYEEPYEIGSDGSKVKEGNFSTNSTGVRDTKDANNAKELGAYKHFVLDLNKYFYDHISSTNNLIDKKFKSGNN